MSIAITKAEQLPPTIHPQFNILNFLLGSFKVIKYMFSILQNHENIHILLLPVMTLHWSYIPLMLSEIFKPHM